MFYTRLPHALSCIVLWYDRVVKGVAKGVIPAQPESDVAIKMLKGTLTL